MWAGLIDIPVDAMHEVHRVVPHDGHHQGRSASYASSHWAGDKRAHANRHGSPRPADSHY
jgi:hypothetical protein